MAAQTRRCEEVEVVATPDHVGGLVAARGHRLRGTPETEAVGVDPDPLGVDAAVVATEVQHSPVAHRVARDVRVDGGGEGASRAQASRRDQRPVRCVPPGAPWARAGRHADGSVTVAAGLAADVVDGVSDGVGEDVTPVGRGVDDVRRPQLAPGGGPGRRGDRRSQQLPVHQVPTGQDGQRTHLSGGARCSLLQDDRVGAVHEPGARIGSTSAQDRGVGAAVDSGPRGRGLGQRVGVGRWLGATGCRSGCGSGRQA